MRGSAQIAAASKAAEQLSETLERYVFRQNVSLASHVLENTGEAKQQLY